MVPLRKLPKEQRLAVIQGMTAEQKRHLEAHMSAEQAGRRQPSCTIVKVSEPIFGKGMRRSTFQ